MNHSIRIKNYSNVFEEITAGGTITPGMLVALNSSGNVVAHANAGQNALPMFALEDELQGNDIDDNYVSGDQAQVWIPTRGDQVLAILADGETVVIGDFLESDGNGYLQKHTAGSAGVVEYPNCIVGVALEAKDLSGSSGEEESSETIGLNKRIIIRII